MTANHGKNGFTRVCSSKAASILRPCGMLHWAAIASERSSRLFVPPVALKRLGGQIGDFGLSGAATPLQPLKFGK
jgi:hypothetical protein